jgi:uncharacterized membrane protein
MALMPATSMALTPIFSGVGIVSADTCTVSLAIMGISHFGRFFL